MSKVESIFGARRNKFGCGFLTHRDIDELLEGKLSAERTDRFQQHQRGGCNECLLLGASVERFRRILEEGVLEVEAGQFAKTEQALKERLREEFQQMFSAAEVTMVEAPWSRELSTDDLEHIAAAGPDTPPTGYGDDDSEEDPESL